MFGIVPAFNNNEVSTKENSFNSLFDMFNEPFFSDSFAPLQNTMKSFKVDVKDTGDAYELTAELPGVKKEDISLDYENGYLTVKAVLNADNNAPENQGDVKDAKDGGKYVRRERYYGTVQRSFYIDNVDKANSKAEYNDGILKVTLPKLAKKDSSTQIDIA